MNGGGGMPQDMNNQQQQMMSNLMQMSMYNDKQNSQDPQSAIEQSQNNIANNETPGPVESAQVSSDV